MNAISNIFGNIKENFASPMLPASVVISVILMVLLISIYEFVIYRLVSHRNFYNKSFNVCVGILPFFIATIILCLQSNIVITLGTIGALAIIRFRTAVKDPVDMLYLLWSVHTGITCGCQLYEVAVITSLVVTVVLLLLEYTNIGKKPLILVLNLEGTDNEEILSFIKSEAKRSRIKSRNFTSKGMDYVIELSVKDPDDFSNKLRQKNVSRFSIIEYDADDIL